MINTLDTYTEQALTVAQNKLRLKYKLIILTRTIETTKYLCRKLLESGPGSGCIISGNAYALSLLVNGNSESAEYIIHGGVQLLTGWRVPSEGKVTLIYTDVLSYDDRLQFRGRLRDNPEAEAWSEGTFYIPSSVQSTVDTTASL